MRPTFLLIPFFALLLAGCGPDADDRIDEPDAMPPSAEPENTVPREGNLHDPETDPAPGTQG
ncbi:hypothetical protein [Halopseudomonas pertucinogena]|uniref:Lipoprotein n=1 Tax=Halopseudomonas pertucinogena TaxID=86175 RepID=A0ABQ2CT10_9GAMM|nr:hypothetical protein [Halopseudomonas pertucinogena]GGJ06101.1 hypothetical protein GCM10009083_23830 [Halopseudomonas pertucinogena]